MATRLEQANAIVERHMNWAFAGGAVPIPIVDTTIVSTIQMKMMFDLAKLYGVPRRAHFWQSFIGSFISAVVPAALTATAFTAGIKSIPVIGTTLGVMTMPTLSHAATYAAGRVFITHFEAGGTLLNLDPRAFREHFRTEFEAAQANRKADA